MTCPRHDNHSTEFGLWLRAQPEIESGLGYRATNLDYIWFKENKWLLIEEKRFGKKPKSWQLSIFKKLHTAAIHDPCYLGFFLLVFEKTNPDDGRMWLNNKEINKTQLLRFLSLNDPCTCYRKRSLFINLTESKTGL